MCLFRSGLFELIGNGDDATLVTAIIAQRCGGDCLWIRSPESRDPRTFEQIFNWMPSLCLEAEIVGAAFQAIRDLSPVYDMIVLDSLAGLRGDHPGARNIAQYVTRALGGLRPTIPVLVTNQHRVPAPPGGIWWREAVISSQSLISVRNRPPLMSQLADSDKWLVWYPHGKPRLRSLKLIEVKYFNLEGLLSRQGPSSIATFKALRARPPWIVDL